MKDSDKANSTQQNSTQKGDNKAGSDAQNKDPLNAQSILHASEDLSYDELLHRFETLLQRAGTLPGSDHRQVAEGLLAGAEELLLRQDEIGADFTIAIIALNEHANQHLLAVLHKSE